MAQIASGSKAQRQPPAPATIVHIPHSSVVIPPEVRSQFVLSDVELHRELLRMTDLYTNELFFLDENVATTIVFGVSRLVVDPERFLDDAQEPMAARGMGSVYVSTSNRRPLRHALTGQQRKALLETYYVPHHARLAQAVQAGLACNAYVLIIDCHSFGSTPLPHEPDQRPHRPDICIGTDPFHTPNSLSEAALALFDAAGYRTALNAPFRGALVPLERFQKDPRVRSIMIELNRAIYIDESTGTKSTGFKEAGSAVRSILSELTRLSRRM